MKRQTGSVMREVVVAVSALILLALLVLTNVLAGAEQAGFSYGLSKNLQDHTGEMCDECVESQACYRLWVWEKPKTPPVSDCEK